MSITLLGNRYVSGLLLMILDRGQIMSQDMKEISTNHKYVAAAAQWMVDWNLVTVENDPQHPRRKIWRLTPLGTGIAELLAEATRMLNVSRLDHMRPDIRRDRPENAFADTHTGDRRC